MSALPAETMALAAALRDRLSPELLFGIGGGTGFGWFTYGDHSTLLTRITTRETPKESFLLDICTRLGLEVRLAGASGSPALGRRIAAALAAGDAVVVPVGGPGMSYGAVAVDRVTEEVLARAAALPGAARNRFLALRPIALDTAALHKAIQAGLRAHVRQMRDGFGPPSTRASFGLAGFERWRRSAPTLDAEARARLREQIDARGGGPAMRHAQAAFLDEAGLERAAELTRRAADAWSAAATAPTADSISAVEAAERKALEAVEAGIRPAS